MYSINILPPKMRKKQKKIKIGNPTYAPFLFMGVLISAFFLNFQIEMKLSNVEEEKLLMQKEIKSVQLQVDEVTNIVSQIQMAKQSLTDRPEEMPGGMPTKSIKWDLLLDEVAATVPPEVTITSIKENPLSGLIEVQANTYTLTHMARTKESFEKSNYFGTIDVPTLTQKHTNLLSRPLEVSFVLTFSYFPNGDKQNFAGMPPEDMMGADPSNLDARPDDRRDPSPERDSERDAERNESRESAQQNNNPPADSTPAVDGTPAPAETEQSADSVANENNTEGGTGQ